MKSIFDPLSTKVLLAVCGIMAALASVIGFLADSQGYLSNLMAEFTGFFVGIILTFLIIDIYTQHNREVQWAKVKRLTYMALIEHFIEIIMQLCIQYKKNYLLKGFIELRNIPSKAALIAFDKLIQDFESNNHNSFGNLVNFYNSIHLELHEIRQILIPRIIQSSDKQPIIDALVEFDNFIMELEYMILTHKHVKEKDFYPGCITELLERIKEIFKILVNSKVFATQQAKAESQKAAEMMQS